MATKPRAKSAAWPLGWYPTAAHQPSAHHHARPAGARVSLVVLHSISLPPGRYGTTAVTALFTNRLDPQAHPSFVALEGLRVSAHFVIWRHGGLTQFVSTHRAAWHAGVSHWQGRQRCNDFSVGIELEGLEQRRFAPAQYQTLLPLLRALCAQHPITAVVGHEHVAPGRKHDPGGGFIWHTLRPLVREFGVTLGG